MKASSSAEQENTNKDIFLPSRASPANLAPISQSFHIMYSELLENAGALVKVILKFCGKGAGKAKGQQGQF